MGLNQGKEPESTVARTGASRRKLVMPKRKILGWLIATWAAGGASMCERDRSEVRSWD